MTMTPQRPSLYCNPTQLQTLRRKMIGATSAFITWGLAHDRADRRIPTRPAGKGCFSRAESAAFWIRLSSR
jgi:hypothetical protein